MYELLAIANYEDRYVIPKAHAEQGQELMREQGIVRPGLRWRAGQLRGGREPARQLVADRPVRRGR